MGADRAGGIRRLPSAERRRLEAQRRAARADLAQQARRVRELVSQPRARLDRAYESHLREAQRAVSALARSVQVFAPAEARRVEAQLTVLQLALAEACRPGSTNLPLPRSRPGSGAIAAAAHPVRLWSDVATDAELRLRDLWSADIRITSSDPALPTVRLERIAGRRPFCVAWATIADAGTAQGMHESGWSLWRPTQPIESRRHDPLGRPEDLDGGDLVALVATTRHEDIAEFGRLTCTRMGAQWPGPAAVRVRFGECDPAEHRRRLAVADVVERARRASSGRSRGDVLTHCLGCGRPLTDHASARRGYGPVCKPRGEAEATWTQLMNDPRQPTVFHVAGVAIDQWRAVVADAANRAVRQAQ